MTSKVERHRTWFGGTAWEYQSQPFSGPLPLTTAGPRGQPQHSRCQLSGRCDAIGDPNRVNDSHTVISRYSLLSVSSVDRSDVSFQYKLYSKYNNIPIVLIVEVLIHAFQHDDCLGSLAHGKRLDIPSLHWLSPALILTL